MISNKDRIPQALFPCTSCDICLSASEIYLSGNGEWICMDCTELDGSGYGVSLAYWIVKVKPSMEELLNGRI